MRRFLKIIKWLVIVVVFAVVSLTILSSIPFSLSTYKGENHFRKEGDYPLIIPHGGAKKLAPENTIYSYEMLVNDFGADVLEIDLALTKDGVLIAHHDLDLEFSDDSLMNGALIKDYTYEEILFEYENDDYYLARTFEDPNGNKPFETLPKTQLSKMVPADLEEDIFKKVGNNVLYILEIKDSPTSERYEEGSDRFEIAAQKLIDLVQDYNLENYVTLASFSDEVTSYFKTNAPSIMINAGISEVTKFAVFNAFKLDFFWKVKSEVLILPNESSMSPITGTLAKVLDLLPTFIRKKIAVKVPGGYQPSLMQKALIKTAHKKNLAVLYWTINDEEEMRYLIKIGADGIITDRPDLLKQIIDELKNND